MLRNMFAQVAPRYTPGSPAMVHLDIAARVAAQEHDAYKYRMAGYCGPEEQLRAERLGLMGIAEILTETRKGWDVEDLITHERYLRPFRRS